MTLLSADAYFNRKVKVAALIHSFVFEYRWTSSLTNVTTQPSNGF